LQALTAGGGHVQAVGYGAYQRVQAETSSPGELIVLLYDALLKNLRRGVVALEAGEADQVNEALTRAQDITLELRTSLDSSTELAEQLSPLYTYIFRSLVLANVNKDISLVRELEAMVTPMRNAWVFAVRGETPPDPAMQNEAARA
jgi:flagellar secretion chaperone FliS